MSQSRVRMLAGLAGTLLVTGVAVVPVAAHAATPVRATTVGVPKASSLVTVKAKRLADLKVGAHGVTSFRALGVGGVPSSGVAAVAIKLTASKPASSGALVAYPSGAKRPGVLSVSFSKGHDATAVVLVVPAANGRIATANVSAGAVRVIPTVVGYYRKVTATATPVTYFTAVPAKSILSVRLGAKKSVAVTVTGVHGVPATATAVVLEVSALTPAKAGVFTVTPSGAAKSKVTALAFTAGHNATNLVTAAGGAKGRVVLASSSKGVVRARVDVVGYLIPLATPGVPTSVVASVTGSGSVTVSWQKPATGGSPITAFTVTAGHAAPVKVAAAVTAHTFTGLTVGQTVTATVTATNAVGTSAASAPSAAVVVTGPTGTGLTTAVSVDSAGAYHGSGVNAGTIAASADGRYVVFSSSSAVVGGDNAHHANVYVRDRQLNTTTLVSNAGAGVYGNGDSTDASISADGRYVAFDSLASNLVVGDTNGREDVFVWDATTGLITRVSVSDIGAEGAKASLDPAISADGRYVAFLSNTVDLITGETNPAYNVYVRDTVSNTTTRVSGGGGLPLATNVTLPPTISPDGRYVGYTSADATIVPGDTNAVTDAFVYDQTAHATSRVSVGAGGVQGNGASSSPVIAGNDREVAFQSDATNLVTGDTNAKTDVFVRDLVAGTTTRVSVADDGSQATDASVAPSISADGSRVLFTSLAGNLVVGDSNGQPDAFVRYLSTGETLRVSLTTGQLAGGATARSISPDGLVVLFSSTDALFPADTNGVADLFARTLG